MDGPRTCDGRRVPILALSKPPRTTADRILAIVPPISAFVAAGFEYSIANMYFVRSGEPGTAPAGRVCPPSHPGDSDQKAARYLDSVRRRLGRRGVRTRMLVRAGDPVEEILACARAERVALVAMSTHGRSGLRRALFGSVAQGVLRRVPVPILLVRAARP
jgi:nucleotide-binding universal stress UspA family protein